MSQFIFIISLLQDVSGFEKMNDESELSEIIQMIKDVQIQSKNVPTSAAEGENEDATSQAIDPATKLEELEKRNSQTLDMKERLEAITKKQKEKLITLQQKIDETRDYNAKEKNEMQEKKHDMDDLLEITNKQQEEELKLLIQYFVQTKDDHAIAEELKTSVSSLHHEIQSEIAACKVELQEQLTDDGVNDQLDEERTAHREESPFKKLKTE